MSHVPFHRSNTCLSPIPTVLTDAPQIVQATVSHGQLSLQWLPPLELLAEQLDYQVRYTTENSHDWKVRPGQDTPTALPVSAADTRQAGDQANQDLPLGALATPLQPCLSSALPRRSCRFHEELGKKCWTCGLAPATTPRCAPSPAGRGIRAAGAPGPNPWWLMPWPIRVRDRAGLEAAARGAARLTAGDGECWKWGGNTGQRVTELRRAQKWWV